MNSPPLLRGLALELLSLCVYGIDAVRERRAERTRPADKPKPLPGFPYEPDPRWLRDLRGWIVLRRIDLRLGLTIGEVADDGSEVAPETLESAAHLVSLAAPGGLCISRSVREAVASKLAIKFQDVSVEGRELDTQLRSIYRVEGDRPAKPAGSKFMKLTQGLSIPRPVQAGLAARPAPEPR